MLSEWTAPGGLESEGNIARGRCKESAYYGDCIINHNIRAASHFPPLRECRRIFI